MTHPSFFGYGSLVNLATHSYHNPRLARLSGWRRSWCHTDLRPVSFLSVIPDTGHTLDGLVADVPGADWSALDAREHAYTRHDATHLVTLEAPATHVALYVASQGAISAPSHAHPILLSYIDVVTQGLLAMHGRSAVEHFFHETANWGPVRDDRAAPVYPRAQRLSAAETDLVDASLRAIAAEIISA